MPGGRKEETDLNLDPQNGSGLRDSKTGIPGEANPGLSGLPRRT